MKQPILLRICVAAWLLWGATLAWGQLSQDQMAELLLQSGRKAFNEKSHAFAVAKFREFLAKFPGHKEAASVRYGLAVALLDGPDKNYTEARDLLQAIAGAKDNPEQPFILYHLGLAMRGQGLQELRLAQEKPAEAKQRQANAQQRFGEAVGPFTQALTLLSQRVKDVPREIKDLPADVEWAARARCDLAEMLLRVQKTKEARDLVQPFVKDPVLSRSRYRDQGRYFYGFASFLLKDYPAAEQALTMVAPFTQPDFGTHARYLLARTHHLADEKAEAAVHYEGLIADHAKSKADAAAVLKQPKKLEPAERARLEALVKDPPPDQVQRATFYLAVLLYEGGRFAEAKARFAEFVKLAPQSPLALEAELRIGFCQVQLKEFPEALKTLPPLVERDARLSDQVLYWLGKAQAGAAPDARANPQGRVQALQAAITTLRQAAERALKIQDQDAEARTRRAQALLEIADVQQQLKQHKEAAAGYTQILNEKLLPERADEVLLRLVAALHLAGDFSESDKAAARFLEQHGKSPLVPAVLFHQAENSYFRAVAAEKNPNAAERAKEVARYQEEAIKRFSVLIEKYPEFPQVNLARFSLGLTYYRMGNLDAARKVLASIPGPERSGELALTPYLIADCVLRQTPTTVPEDGLAAAKMEEQLKSATEMLEAFIGGNAGHPQLGDAILKLGLCQQRMASLLVQPPEKTKMLQAARATYERLLSKEFAGHALFPQAILERAKVIAQTGDLGTAQNELRRFLNDPLKNASPAPMALIQLATWLRGQNKAAEAADILAKAREQHEGPLAKDPERSGWIALLRYHHGVALREAGKFSEARQAFELVIKAGTNRPEGAEAALRFGQALKDEGHVKLELARKLSANPKDRAQADKVQDEGYKLLRDAVAHLEGQAEQLKKMETLPEVRARMLYDAAWALRTLAEPEIQAARQALTAELAKKLGPQAAKFPPPLVPVDRVPLQPAEKKARGLYQTLIDAFPDVPLSVEARFELAELLAQRNEYDLAVKLLNDALDKEPAQEMTDKVRLRLGAIHAAKGNLKGALAQFDAVAQNPKSPLVGWAHYRAGEALLHTQQFADAIKRLVVFRDNPAFQNHPGLSDRALLRLGHAFAYVKDWEASRIALERLVNAFPGSPWVDDARYGIGWALQHQDKYDAAVAAYAQVTSRTVAEIAAKAQFQIGLCRLEQKRYLDAANALLVVPYTYDYPELSAAALLEAANAYLQAGQREQAVRLLERLVRDYPNTPFAEAAKEKLADKK